MRGDEKNNSLCDQNCVNNKRGEQEKVTGWRDRQTERERERDREKGWHATYCPSVKTKGPPELVDGLQHGKTLPRSHASPFREL